MLRFSVPDIHCQHCRTSIESALAALPQTAPVVVDLATREVRTGNRAPAEAVIAALAEIGFPARAVAAT